MIAPEGWPFILTPALLGVVVVVFGLPWLGWTLVGLGVFGLYFFRNPPRVCTASPTSVCSPADGKVILVGDSPADLASRGLPQQISIFMSVFDVHVNRAPIGGELVDYAYNPGRKFSAFKDKASLENEQNLIVLKGPAGTLAFKQIAGVIARRIVFDLEIGDEVARGDRVGLIRYGSRVDLFLPPDAQILVGLGERVHAGVTPVAQLSGGEAAS